MFHPRTPRLLGLRLLRDIYLMDLVQFALSPSVSVELKLQAETQIIGRIPHCPLDRKLHWLAAGRDAVASVSGCGRASGSVARGA